MMLLRPFWMNNAKVNARVISLILEFKQKLVHLVITFLLSMDDAKS